MTAAGSLFHHCALGIIHTIKRPLALLYWRFQVEKLIFNLACFAPPAIARCRSRIFADIAATLVTATIRNRGHYADRLTSTESRFVAVDGSNSPGFTPFCCWCASFCVLTLTRHSDVLIRRKRDGRYLRRLFAVCPQADEHSAVANETDEDVSHFGLPAIYYPMRQNVHSFLQVITSIITVHRNLVCWRASNGG